MADDRRRDYAGVRTLVAAAALIIVIAGLKQASSLLLPVIVALFLSLLCVPPMRWLETRGLPTWAALVIVMLVATIAVVLVTAVVGNSVAEFQREMPLYRQRLDQILSDGISSLQRIGIDVAAEDLSDKLDTSQLMGLVAATASGLLSVMSNVFLVVLTMVFMLLEASGFRGKLIQALGKASDDDLADWREISLRVQKYLAIKAQVSLLTGSLVTASCLVLGVDFPLLWGLIAFLFNFVPNIGSIIAAVPACLLALIQLGTGPFLVLAAAYVAINVVIGNVLEPRMMGRRLGLSTLVVFLSLLFWGWVWGPVGMLLSVPLTVVVKIMLEHSEDFRWLAIMLGPGDEDIPELPKAADTIAMPPGGTD